MGKKEKWLLDKSAKLTLLKEEVKWAWGQWYKTISLVIWNFSFFLLMSKIQINSSAVLSIKLYVCFSILSHSSIPLSLKMFHYYMRTPTSVITNQLSTCCFCSSGDRLLSLYPVLMSEGKIVGVQEGKQIEPYFERDGVEGAIQIMRSKYPCWVS